MTVQSALTQDDEATPQQTCAWRPDPGSSPPPCWHDRATDRDKLHFACATLTHYGIVATPSQHGDPEQVTARLVAGIRSRFPDADGACVFWTTTDEANCLGPDGSLHARLVVHVHGAGVATAATAAFEQAGLATESGPSPDVLLVTGHERATPAPAVVPTAEPCVGVEVRCPVTRSQASAVEVSRQLEPTPLRLDRFDADADGGDGLRLVLVGRDAATPVTDHDVADVVVALSGRLSWWSITKLCRADLVPSETRLGQDP